MIKPDCSEIDVGHIIRASQIWLEQAVIGLNLCPFAKSVHIKNQICYIVSQAQDATSLLKDLVIALQRLNEANPTIIDTTLLIHPWALEDFLDYNDFLGDAEAALEALELTGVIQIASFHPQYQFAGTAADDITNCTNRSPFPMLHLLREDSLDQAIAAMPDADRIVERNIATMEQLGTIGWQQIQVQIQSSFDDRASTDPQAKSE
jgi:hypothetical protein